MQKIRNIKEITSDSNPTVKEIKSLYRKKERWKNESFLVEGIRIVEECLKSDVPIKYIVYSDELFNVNGGERLFYEVYKKNIDIIKFPYKLFKDIADTQNPQGIIAVVKFNLVSFESIIQKKNFLVMLDEVTDPGNMGTIIRTADAFGSNGIVLTEGCVDVFNPKVVRSTMGSIFHVPLCYVEDKTYALERFKQEDIIILTTSLEGKKLVHNVNLDKDFVLIIGNEARGVSEESMFYADELVKIFMPGKAESLNAAIATSIIMYEAAKQRV